MASGSGEEGAALHEVLRGTVRQRRTGRDLPGQALGDHERGGVAAELVDQPEAMGVDRTEGCPVRSICSAMPRGRRRGSRWVPPAPGRSPSLISGTPRRASSAATRRSHARASSSPPPNAAPSIAATDGFGCCFEAVEDVGERAHEPREAGGALEPGQLADVGAGTERPPLAGDHERAHAVVGLEVDQRGVERGEGVGPDRVEAIGPAQRDDRDGALALFRPAARR